jgi:hypothetical protein
MAVEFGKDSCALWYSVCIHSVDVGIFAAACLNICIGLTYALVTHAFTRESTEILMNELGFQNSNDLWNCASFCEVKLRLKPGVDRDHNTGRCTRGVTCRNGADAIS